MNDWWKMWATLVEKYGKHPNAYFEIFNEPHMYSKEELREIYATWLEKFPDVPRDHILLDGSGLAWNVPDIADDPRFEGCLFAVHEYTFWNMSITTEDGWKGSFKGKVGKYVDRTVCTEWGGAMGPGKRWCALRLHGLQPAAEQLFHGLYPRHERPTARLGNGQFLLAGSS
jgi:Cellulase (glycosyl hydrolase family 5).